MFLIAVALLTRGVGHASPPEGLSNYGVLNKGKAGKSLESILTYNSPVFRADDQSLDVISSLPAGGNLITVGGRATIASTYGEKAGYLLRYDWMVGQQSSLSLRWTHEEWKYIATSKESFGFEFNVANPLQSGGLYLAAGGFYRLVKQRWNSPWWSPFNFNTEDRDGFISGLIGWKFSLGERNLYTFDMNIRDTFSYYSLDHIAFDNNFYFSGGGNFYWRILLGVRTSADWVGTMYPAIYYGGIGFVAY